MRIDKYLVENSYFETRNKAVHAIKSGIVFCDGKVIIKPSFVISKGKVTINGSPLKYVSKGGLKLEKALESFSINLENKKMLDIGSSTGGFTDCALQNNVDSVIAVDVGSNQMVDKVKKNAKVSLYEGQDIRTLNKSLMLDVDLTTIDVSFISVTKFISIFDNMDNLKEIICLIKPQFECGKEVAKRYRGIVLNNEVHSSVIKDVINEFNQYNFYLNGLVTSPIKGGSGNLEYLAYFKKDLNSNNQMINIDKLVNSNFS